MPLIADTWTGKLDLRDPAAGNLVAGWFNAFRSVVNALDNTNFVANSGINTTKLDYGVFIGPAAPGSVRKILRGKKAIATGAAAPFYNGANALITFSTDTEDPAGASGFKAATVPVVVAIAVGLGAAGIPVDVSITTPSNTTCQIQLQRADNVTNLPANVTVHWVAIGEQP